MLIKKICKHKIKKSHAFWILGVGNYVPSKYRTHEYYQMSPWKSMGPHLEGINCFYPPTWLVSKKMIFPALKLRSNWNPDSRSKTCVPLQKLVLLSLMGHIVTNFIVKNSVAKSFDTCSKIWHFCVPLSFI